MLSVFLLVSFNERSKSKPKKHIHETCQKYCILCTKVSGEKNPIEINYIHLTMINISPKYKVINYGLRLKSNE